MEKLDWHECYEIGVKFIDDDHKKILALMRRLYAAVEQGDCDSCLLLSNEILVETAAHFMREEAYLKKIRYPDLEEHIRYHMNLLVQAGTFKRICRNTRSEQDLENCLNAMEELLVDDVLVGDIRFKSFLEYEGHIRPSRYGG